MNRIYILTIIITLLVLQSCDRLEDKTPSLDVAESEFIKSVQELQEKDALLNGVSWYKTPEIKERRLSRRLLGKEIVEEMDYLLLKDEYAIPDSELGFRIVWDGWGLQQTKMYALNHLDEYIADEFYFSGIFTSSDANIKYYVCKERMIYIYKPIDMWWHYYVSPH